MLFLTAKAQEVYIHWLSTVVEDFDNQDQDAWVSHAECVAMNAEKGEDIVIEVRTNESLTGRPETFKLPPEWFAAFPPSKY